MPSHAAAALRDARANRVFCTDEKHIRTENTVIDKSKDCVIYTRSPIACGRLFVRAQSVIRADGFFVRAKSNRCKNVDAIRRATHWQ
jgi:hypothetical protein